LFRVETVFDCDLNADQWPIANGQWPMAGYEFICGPEGLLYIPEGENNDPQVHPTIFAGVSHSRGGLARGLRAADREAHGLA
jgi:hypothetical protein